MKKIFVLFTMLFASLSFKGANDTNKMVVADAAEIGSYAYLDGSWNSKITTALSAQGVSDISLLKNLLITNDGSKVPTSGNLEGCPVEVGLTDDYHAPTNYTNGCAVGAYIYPNVTDATMFDCILYADVETIYPYTGGNLFSNLINVEKITFDCNFSMAKAADKSMYRMFNKCGKLAQIEGLINLDTSNVKDMGNMFSTCSSLTELDVSSFDTSKVTNMYAMFGWCDNLITIKGLEKLNTSNVTNMASLFYNSRKLETLNLSNFDTSKVTDMCDMFGWCEKLTTIKGLENFNTSNVTSMKEMFYCCYNLAPLDVSHFDTSKVTSMDSMFTYCRSLTELDVSNFDTTNVTDMNEMFSSCSSLTTLDVSNFNTSNVTLMYSMFGWCEKLTTIKGLENFDTSKVTNMRGMFGSCRSLTELDVSGFDTSKVTNMSSMFSNCLGLTELDVSNFDTSNVTNMSNMFSECKNITAIKGLENFDTSKVTNMRQMFYYCASLTTLDLSNFDLSSITDATKLENFILSTNHLTEIKVPKNLNGLTIQLPGKFGMTEIDPSMEGWTLLQGSKEFNILYNALMKLKTCDDYMQSPELQAIYDGLVNEEKEKLATLTDNDGVLLTEKLAYMCYLAESHTTPATAETYMSISPVAGQYLVIVIACLSLTLIGGYYLLQKRKYAK